MIGARAKLAGLPIGLITVWIGGLMLTAMMLQIGVEVLIRVAGGKPFAGTVEIVSKYYMVGVSFLPVAFAELHKRHIEATVFTDMFPQWLQNALRVVAIVLSLTVYGLLAWQTCLEAMKQTARGAFAEAGQVNIITWPSYWILPVSFALMCVVLLARLVAGDLDGSFGSEDN